MSLPLYSAAPPIHIPEPSNPLRAKELSSTYGSSAACSVYHTPELLERVLSYLDNQSLRTFALLERRICHPVAQYLYEVVPLRVMISKMGRETERRAINCDAVRIISIGPQDMTKELENLIFTSQQRSDRDLDLTSKTFSYQPRNIDITFGIVGDRCPNAGLHFTSGIFHLYPQEQRQGHTHENQKMQIRQLTANLQHLGKESRIHAEYSVTSSKAIDVPKTTMIAPKGFRLSLSTHLICKLDPTSWGEDWDELEELQRTGSMHSVTCLEVSSPYMPLWIVADKARFIRCQLGIPQIRAITGGTDRIESTTLRTLKSGIFRGIQEFHLLDLGDGFRTQAWLPRALSVIAEELPTVRISTLSIDSTVLDFEEAIIQMTENKHKMKTLRLDTFTSVTRPPPLRPLELAAYLSLTKSITKALWVRWQNDAQEVCANLGLTIATLESILDTYSRLHGISLDSLNIYDLNDFQHLRFDERGEPVDITVTLFARTINKLQGATGKDLMKRRPSLADFILNVGDISTESDVRWLRDRLFEMTDPPTMESRVSMSIEGVRYPMSLFVLLCNLSKEKYGSLSPHYRLE